MAESKRAKMEYYDRVWCDGCYDMMHFGHANSLRQAKEHCDYLVVGVHSDEEIRKNKGEPVMKEQERYDMVRACKWVDEVVEGAPYVTQLDVLDKYGCKMCGHGDDITTDADGNDTYQAIKDAGRYLEVKRTQGVSTTDLVGRMLLCQKSAQEKDEEKEPLVKEMASGNGPSPYTGVKQFVLTSQKIVQFSSGNEPKEGDLIVYLPGAFDVFHIGHVKALQAAKNITKGRGDRNVFLIAGVYGDSISQRFKGANYPIMTLNERVLSVLSCRYVDQVVINAPYIISEEEILKPLKVDLVLQGVHGSDVVNEGDVDPYAVPKGMPSPFPGGKSMYETFDSGCEMTTDLIIDRILSKRKEFQDRNRKKTRKGITSPRKAQTNGG